MSVGAVTSTLVTTEEMLALPENGMDHELIRGELREKALTRRNKWHSRVECRIGQLLLNWLDSHPSPGSLMASGEAGFRLSRNPDTMVGIDVAYVSAEVAARTPEHQPYFEGPPILAVEITSPSDTDADVREKIELYRETGVALIWVVNPGLKTVLVIRAGDEPELFNVRQELSGEPQLPGFRVAVSEIFRL